MHFKQTFKKWCPKRKHTTNEIKKEGIFCEQLQTLSNIHKSQPILVGNDSSLQMKCNTNLVVM